MGRTRVPQDPQLDFKTQACWLQQGLSHYLGHSFRTNTTVGTTPSKPPEYAFDASKAGRPYSLFSELKLLYFGLGFTCGSIVTSLISSAWRKHRHSLKKSGRTQRKISKKRERAMSAVRRYVDWKTEPGQAELANEEQGEIQMEDREEEEKEVEMSGTSWTPVYDAPVSAPSFSRLSAPHPNLSDEEADWIQSSLSPTEGIYTPTSSSR